MPDPTPRLPLRAWLQGQSAELGFRQMRVAEAGPLDMRHYDAMLAEGRQAGLDWLAASRDDRADPRRLLPGCRSVVVFAFDHGGPAPPDPGGLTGRVSRYAWGGDYHNVVLKKLRKIQRRMRVEQPGIASWSAVDNRPVFERAWAARAGLGWAAKNACQVVPSVGSSFFLGILLLDAALEPDPPLGDHCGRCTRCVEACPTGALRGDGALDARLCLSYWNIEADGPIPAELHGPMGRWIFGCDDCQTVCPHDRDAAPAASLGARQAWLDLPELLRSDDATLLARFEGSPIRRAVPHRLKRNAAIVLGNLGGEAAAEALWAASRAEAPMVAEAARSALRRMGGLG